MSLGLLPDNQIEYSIVISTFNEELILPEFSLMDRQVVIALRQMPERNRYLCGLKADAGFKQTGIVVESIK